MHTPLLRPAPNSPSAGQLEIAKAPEHSAIASNVPGSFAWHVFRERHPKLVSQIRRAHPYLPFQHQALEGLIEETLTGRISRLPRSAYDFAAWDAWGGDYFGQRWQDVPFLWAEGYFYRRLLEAIGFFASGPWFWVDPFDFLKAAELQDPALDHELAALDELQHLPPDQRAEALLLASLWGNRADLGFRIGKASTAEQPTRAANLIADDSAAVWSTLASGETRRVCIVADNAGRELLSDLAFLDYLIQAGLVSEVALHLKPHPYYVSDAVTADLVGCLRRLAAASGSAADIAGRIWQLLADGRVTVYTHWFYCAPLSFHHMPLDLASEFESASLTIMKGDLNYRRLVGDCDWPSTTPFVEAASYFPGPVVTLRTLKSDVVVGIDSRTLSALDASREPWRTSGTHGLVQARL
ncbi:damage-control phosphatase ARMT1 family protein [Rhizomonospora bruguierae]|uniref:damage-control phosphatase ARMT1 family protein n=1 Tax=Rhizomonospora bruguierae TaxID=1581705 RepID=UPI001BCA9EFC|nr:damage-control phosphatase ARMT1 family protein [Micromonospora sp. NBRC 107566]